MEARVTPPADYPLRTAVFDFDGTLINSMPMVLASFRHAVAPWADWPDDGGLLPRLGGPWQQCLRNLLGPAQDLRFEDARRRLWEYNREHEEGVAPFPGARELVEDLRGAGVAVGLWTSRDAASTQRHLHRIGWEDLFDARVHADEVAEHKPRPAGLHLALDLLGRPKEGAWYVGDAAVDARAGHAAGVPVLLIHHGWPMDPEALRLARVAVRGPAEAYDLLRNWSGRAR